MGLFPVNGNYIYRPYSIEGPATILPVDVVLHGAFPGYNRLRPGPGGGWDIENAYDSTHVWTGPWGVSQFEGTTGTLMLPPGCLTDYDLGWHSITYSYTGIKQMFDGSALILGEGKSDKTRAYHYVDVAPRVLVIGETVQLKIRGGFPVEVGDLKIDILDAAARCIRNPTSPMKSAAPVITLVA